MKKYLANISGLIITLSFFIFLNSLNNDYISNKMKLVHEINASSDDYSNLHQNANDPGNSFALIPTKMCFFDAIAIAANTILSHAILSKAAHSGEETYPANIETANTNIIYFFKALSSYTDELTHRFQTTFTKTGPSTFNVNQLGLMSVSSTNGKIFGQVDILSSTRPVLPHADAFLDVGHKMATTKYLDITSINLISSTDIAATVDNQTVIATTIKSEAEDSLLLSKNNVQPSDFDRVSFKYSAPNTTTVGSKMLFVDNYAALREIENPSSNRLLMVGGRTTSGDGGGGIFAWVSCDLSIEVTEDPQHGIYIPLANDASGANGAWVRQYSGSVNVRWFGAKGDNSTDDTVTIQKALDYCGRSKKFLYIPAGVYITSSPITVTWDNTKSDTSPFPGIHGDGYSTTLKSTITIPDRAALELLGHSNTVSINTELRNFRIRMSGGSPKAYCLRVGDAKDGLLAERIWLDGANGILLKIASSTSYAQINTVFRQVFIQTNYNREWFTNDGLANVYAVRDETIGAKWDNVIFESCMFIGVVRPRATLVKFLNCQFSTNPARGVIYGYNIYLAIGNLSIDSCYFEDHYKAIFIRPIISNISFVDIRNSHFSGIGNFAEASTRAIEWTASKHTIGAVRIINCEFGDSFYLSETIRNASWASVTITGCTNLDNSLPVRILNEYPNFHIQPAGASDSGLDEISFSRVLTTAITASSEMYLMPDNTGPTSFLIDHDLWISKLEITSDKQMTGGDLSVMLQKNGTTIGIFSLSSFIKVNSGTGFYAHLRYPFYPGGSGTSIFHPGDLLSIKISSSNLAPTPDASKWVVNVKPTLVY